MKKSIKNLETKSIKVTSVKGGDNRKIYSDIGGTSTTYMTWNP